MNFIFAFHGNVKGAYLCLAEVKWVKTGVPEVKPLLGVKGWEYNVVSIPAYLANVNMFKINSKKFLN